MDGEAGIKEARMVFERAITAVGLHVTEVGDFVTFFQDCDL